MNNTKRNYLKFFAGATIGAALITGFNKINSNEVEKNPIPIVNFQRSNKSIPVGPEYSSKDVPTNMCSRYARVAAKTMFDLEYPSDDAWDLRDAPNVLEIPVKNKKDLENLAENGTLKEGMILAIYNPSSKYNQVAKNDGAGYTHVALYIGQKDGKMYFADKFGKETRASMDLDSLLKKGNLEPREILYLDNKQPNR